MSAGGVYLLKTFDAYILEKPSFLNDFWGWVTENKFLSSSGHYGNWGLRMILSQQAPDYASNWGPTNLESYDVF